MKYFFVKYLNIGIKILNGTFYTRIVNFYSDQSRNVRDTFAVAPTNILMNRHLRPT